jgi:hypothetical protein
MTATTRVETFSSLVMLNIRQFTSSVTTPIGTNAGNAIPVSITNSR